MRRSPYRNAGEPLAQGFGQAFSGAFGAGIKSVMDQRAEQQKEDALLRRLSFQAQLEQQGQEAKQNRAAVIENIGQLDVPIDVRNTALDVTSWPAETQAALRADMGNVDVNAVDERTRRALQAMQSGPRVKKTSRVMPSLFDVARQVVSTRYGQQGVEQTLSTINNLDPVRRKGFYADVAEQIRNAAQLEGLEPSDEEVSKAILSIFHPSAVREAAQARPRK